MNLNAHYFTKFFIAFLFVLFFCEYLIYYFVIIQCSWPILNPNKAESNIRSPDEDERPIRVIFLADTHLLGSRNGHWFDKLRREWQMYRAFQTAITLHEPDVVFVLGDLFDEGLWCSEKEFNYYIKRFDELFHTPSKTQIYVVAGNHDIGFHYGVSPYIHERFATAFKAPPVQFVTIQGNHFVLLNSMAMEGDGCFLCQPAELELQKISKRLKCTRGVGTCDRAMLLERYSRPILLQHFPMYRESDAECKGPDSAPQNEKNIKFRERWECISEESSQQLLDMLNPRWIVTGHTHHGCTRTHRGGSVLEWTVPSFSWRNRNNPSFIMAVISPDNFAMSKCYMPLESTVIHIYGIASSLLLLGMCITYRRSYRRWFKAN